ncbi:MAG: NUDIX domain-containing protein [Flavobacteriales bacterium]|nr:NUDIX domain-containing protein [Flavobacteriales bacterium]
MSKFPFNVRVYIILIHHEGKHVLCSDELIHGKPIVKFPGGGLEFGEGPVECAHREAMEELAIEIDNIEHFYTTDFFIQSAFNPAHQVISIYYKAIANESAKHISWVTSTDEVHLCEETGGKFSWVELGVLNPETMTFPGDQEVVKRFLRLTSGL